MRLGVCVCLRVLVGACAELFGNAHWSLAACRPLHPFLCVCVCVSQVPVRGSIRMDDGAVAAVVDRKKSLFAAGITAVHVTLSSMHTQTHTHTHTQTRTHTPETSALVDA